MTPPINASSYPAPSAATIAAAVAAPSAATIAAAVAAPSAATIAAAVAAPSTSAIATAVAAAVPTRANIQSDIQTYTPKGISWSLLNSFTSTTAQTTISFTGISGYKYLRVYFAFLNGSLDTTWYMRFNSVSSSKYSSGIRYSNSSNQTGNISGNYQSSSIGTYLMRVVPIGIIDIEDCNNTNKFKNISMRFNGVSSSGPSNAIFDGHGFFDSDSAVISTIDIVFDKAVSGSPTTGAGIYLYGGN